MVIELVWTRPLGLAALALPVLLLLLARWRAVAAPRATGTLAIWREVQRERIRARGTAQRRLPPAATWLAAGALLCGALALAGPEPARRAAPRTWTLVLDASPSTSLPAPGVGVSRRERALDAALAGLAARARPGDRVRWRRSDGAELELALGERPTGAWLAASGPELEPAWLDRPGTLVVTDAPPAARLESAGWYASGAAPEPGPVGVVGRDRLDWDGERVVRVGGAAPERVVALGADVPAVVRRIVAAWAGARGLSVDGPGAERSGEVALRVERDEPAGAPARELALARDGWSARAEGAGLAAGALPGERTWLAAHGQPAGTRAVAAAPGRVRLGFRALDEPAGDPAAFAVSWAELFDGAALPPRGAVSLGERLVAAEAFERPPRPLPSAGDAAPAGGSPLSAWLAVAALSLGVAAVSVGLGAGRPG